MAHIRTAGTPRPSADKKLSRLSNDALAVYKSWKCLDQGRHIGVCIIWSFTAISLSTAVAVSTVVLNMSNVGLYVDLVLQRV